MKTPVIFIAVLVFLAIGFGYFVTYPSYVGWQGQRAISTKLDTDIKNLEKKQKTAEQVKTAEAKIREQATKARQLFPNEEDRESFISEFDALSKANGLTLTVFNYSSAPKIKKSNDDEPKEGAAETTKRTKETGKTLGFAASVTGTYESIKQFLGQTRGMNRYVTINENIISVQEGGLVAATIDGVVYYRDTPKASDTLEYSPKLWQYLDQIKNQITISSPAPKGGRPNPFALYTAAPTQ